MTELGGRLEAYARRARLDPAALDADDLLVPDVAMAEVLEVAAADLACPDLGLRIAARQDLSEQAVLTRVCRRWWGRTPREVRRNGLD